MYPQAEVAGRASHCLDPDNFRYTIKTKGNDRDLIAGTEKKLR